MEAFVFISLGFLIYVIVCYWVATQVRYRVSRHCVRILLFGVCLRRLDFEEIESVSKRRPEGWTENWSNTFQSSHRVLVLRRRKGLRRCIIITPKNRYILKAAIEKAIQRGASPIEQDDESLSVISD